MTGIEDKHLALIEHSIELSRLTLAQLLEGKAGEANTVSKQRLSCIQDLPFQQFDTIRNPELVAPLQELLELDKKLRATSEQIKATLEQELTSVKKSFSAAKAYQDIGQHNKN